MTTAKSARKFRLPDPPEHPDEQMTNFDHIALNGTAYLLSNHLGNPATTLIAGERFLVVRPTRGMAGSMYPDLLIAFDVDPVSYKENNGYTIDEQGKPPDFVMEIASRRTGRQDIVGKRDGYAALGIPEYWRFDETGEFHGTLLAGDWLAPDGQYQARRHRRSGRRRSTGLQPGAEPAHPLGERSTKVARPGNRSPHRKFRERARGSPAGRGPRP